MSQTPQPRSIEQLIADFRRDRPNEPQSLYDLVRKYLIDCRTEVTIANAERKAKQKGYYGLDGHPYMEEYG